MSFTFDISNYLNKSIRIKVLVDGRREVDIVKNIEPREKHRLNQRIVDKYFTNENLIKIYTLTNNIPEFLSACRVTTPSGTTINSLNVGMVTSKWVGANSDYNIGKAGLNAVQGLPYVRIHNMTGQTLYLNGNIKIEPESMIRYKGRDHFGVRLGTVFRDMKGVFSTFTWSIPATDLYYGIVSDVKQPIFGGYQSTEEFNHDSTQPHYLLENGWMGGNARGNIKNGYIPREGNVLSQDRWGVEY